MPLLQNLDVSLNQKLIFFTQVGETMKARNLLDMYAGCALLEMR